jgi:hypothetical protein
VGFGDAPLASWYWTCLAPDGGVLALELPVGVPESLGVECMLLLFVVLFATTEERLPRLLPPGMAAINGAARVWGKGYRGGKFTSASCTLTLEGVTPPLTALCWFHTF